EKSKLGMAGLYPPRPFDALRAQADGDGRVGVFGGAVAELAKFVGTPTTNGVIGGEQHTRVTMAGRDCGSAEYPPRRGGRVARIVVAGAELAGHVEAPTGHAARRA